MWWYNKFRGNIPNKLIKIMLFKACRKGHFEIVKILLLNKANVNVYYHTYHLTPLIDGKLLDYKIITLK